MGKLNKAEADTMRLAIKTILKRHLLRNIASMRLLLELFSMVDDFTIPSEIGQETEEQS